MTPHPSIEATANGGTPLAAAHVEREAAHRSQTAGAAEGSSERVRSELKSEILGRQAKLGTAEDGRGPFRIVADVCPHGMDIAPGALERVMEKDDAAAAGLEQAVYGPHTPVHRLGGIPSVARSVGQGNFLSGAGQAHHLLAVAEQSVMHGIHFCGGFCQAELDERIFSHAHTVARRYTRLGLFPKGVQRAEGRTHRRGSNGTGKEAAKGEAIEGSRH